MTYSGLARELGRCVLSLLAAADVKGSLLDAYLCAAGMCQVLEDYLDRDATGLRRLGEAVERSGVSWAPPAARAVAAFGGAVGVAWSPVRDRGAITLCVARLQRMIRDLADQLVRLTPDIEDGRFAVGIDDLIESSHRLEREVAGLPTRVRDDLARLPACFFSFDLKPDDCGAMAEQLGEVVIDRSSPLLIVGVRTSGSYLAPLTAAHLRRRGFRYVETVTWRPGGWWSREARRAIRGVVGAHGVAAVVDDPPGTGDSVASTCEELIRRGFPPASVIPLIFAFVSTSRQVWRKRLAAYRSMVLPQRYWATHQTLRSPLLRESLSAVMIGKSATITDELGSRRTIKVARIGRVQRVRPASDTDCCHRRSPRGHLRASFSVDLVDMDGRLHRHLVCARGIGLGFFGHWSLSSQTRLEGWVPEVYGACSGICFQACPLPQCGLLVQDGDCLVAAVEPLARYVATRQSRLSLPDDPTLRLLGRDTLWDRCRHLLGSAFGRAGIVAREQLRPCYRRLLGADRPSLVDGSMSPRNWFVAPNSSLIALVKANHDEESFWSGAPFCLDGAFDLATAAVEFGAWSKRLGSAVDVDSRLREAYLREARARIDPERWLLLKLTHLQTSRQRLLHQHRLHECRTPGRHHSVGSGLEIALDSLEAEMSGCMQRYWSEAFFDHTSAARRDHVCGIDIDGVLETPWLGFPSLTPAGAAALWSLAHHGYGVVLASGRSLEEVRDRCRNYRLAGGVAEYGGAWYDRATGTTVSLLTDSQRADLDELRHSLQTDDARLLGGFEHSVRACAIRGDHRTGLSEEQIDEALARSGARDRLQVIRGDQQTDFVPVGIDKGAGLRALLGQLGPRADRHLTAGVGDSAADLPMLRMAARPFAPANADPELRAVAPDAGIKIVRRSNQAGLALAVKALIGHRPGGCDLCRLPSMSDREELLMQILGAQDVGPVRKTWRALTIGGGVMRP